jgi:hypothetical protein
VVRECEDTLLLLFTCLCVGRWTVIYFIFRPAFFFFLAFPIHESAPFTLEWLFVELGLFYMQEGMEIRGGCEGFFFYW